RDDVLFSTIKVVSRHQTTQQYDVILPIELTTEDIRNKEELSWNSFDDEDVDEQTKGRKESERDKTDESDDGNDDDNDDTVKVGFDKDDDDNDDE
nr:hypothetical protein [Tanacetum cinerariifolium]